jgi:hypothetical protein
MTARVALTEARWSKKPPIPISAIALILGFGIFVVALISLRAIVGEETVRAWGQGPGRIGMMLTGFAVVGMAFALVRGFFKGNIVVGFAPSAVTIDGAEIPYSAIERVEYANCASTQSVRAGHSDETTDAILHINAGAKRVRLIAPDTHVLDFLPAFDALMTANPDAIVVPLAMFT